MDDLVSLNDNQEHLLATVNELTLRFDQLEEYIKEHSTRPKFSDIITTESTQLSELSDKVDQIITRLSLEKGPATAVQDNFLQSYFTEMTMTISMPGIKFVGQRYRAWFHNCLWVFIHMAALLISYIYIKEEFENWQRSPVVRTSSNNLTFVNETPFPAISICLAPSLNSGYDYTGNVKSCFLCNNTKKGHACAYSDKCNFDEAAKLALASVICRNTYNGSSSSFPWYIFEENIQSSIKSELFLKYSQNVFPLCDFTISKERSAHDSVYKKMIYYESDCYENEIQHLVSSYGMCFTINGLRHEDIYKKSTILSVPFKLGSYAKEKYKGAEFSLDNMIYFNGNIGTIPAYLSEDHVVTFKVKERKNNKYFCDPEKQDVGRFTIHNPVEVPFSYEHKFFIARGEGLHIRVTPELVTNDKSLENFKPNERGCFYSHERELSMFKHYSENNCQAECIANCSLQRCGCVPYFLPRHNTSVNVCLSLCENARTCDCSCMPDCNSLSYEFESLKIYGKDYSGLLYISYKKSGFYATVRVSISNLAQFMAYCLGIVGVFNGFSVMMFFEVFYLFTFQLWISVKTYLK